MKDQYRGQFERIAKALGDVQSRFVLCGGSITSFLLDDDFADEPRETLDVDLILDVSTRVDYQEIDALLRQKGFRSVPVENTPICRWDYQGVLVDIMPIDESIFGFSNRWYEAAFEHAVERQFSANCSWRLLTPCYFLATKWEAFKQRGAAMPEASHDLEDIISVINGRSDIIELVADQEDALKDYLKQHAAALLSNADVRGAIPMHLLPDAASQMRLPIIIERLEKIGEA